ncbi:MAG: S8 family serine peptidase, partial [Clostridia bacterium]|nr:S8 family serine peptidase [Clostridia bacterium]
MIGKIHKNLLSQVKTQSTNNYSAVVSSLNYFKTEEELKKLKIDYKGYPFASCFLVEVDYSKLISISDLSSVQSLSGTTKVSSCISDAKQFLNIDNLTENKYFGSDITIAFIDTGISPHLDFIFPYNRIIEFVDLVNHKTLPYDDNGHGTFVVSVCSGSGKRLNNQYSGIAPLTKIVMIKALNHKGETSSDRILDAMQYVYDNKDRLNIKIVCMSFGADNLGVNDPLQKGANSLWNKGIAVVAAAGNSGPNEKTIKSPGTSSRIITVGGLDTTDIENLKVADFSSRG